MSLNTTGTLLLCSRLLSSGKIYSSRRLRKERGPENAENTRLVHGWQRRGEGCELLQRTRDISTGFEVACHVDSPSNETRMFQMLIECRKIIILECSKSAVRIHFKCRSIFLHFECTSNVLSMRKTFRLVTRMCPNIRNAHRIQSECLECTSNINECRRTEFSFRRHCGSFRHSCD